MKIAACGNDCEKCPRYAATRSQDPTELERVRLIWIKAGWRDESSDIGELLCTGCSESSFCRYGVAACAGARELENCGLCPEYPCSRISAMLEQSQKYARQCRVIFSAQDFALLESAFFEKAKNLETARAKSGPI